MARQAIRAGMPLRSSGSPEVEASQRCAASERRVEMAKSVCATCTVTEICLQYALESSQDSGVWGGLSEDERRALKRRAARARRAS